MTQPALPRPHTIALAFAQADAFEREDMAVSAGAIRECALDALLVPHLLSALRKLNDPWKYPKDVCDIARAAIAKAEGRSS